MPLLVWLVHGPDRDALFTRVVAGYWLVTSVIGIPWILSFFQESIWLVSRPGILAWLGTVDVLGALLVYILAIYLRRRRVNLESADSRSREPDPRPST